jgi:signal transduction histidine kinase
VRIGTLATFALGLSAVIRYWLLEIPLVAGAVVATMATCTASLILLERTRRVDLCGNLSVAALYLLLVVSISASGGFYDPNFSWLYTVPVAAAYLIDQRSGWVWAGVISATTVVFWQLPELGIIVPNHVPVEQQTGQALFNRLTAILGLSVLSTSFVFSQRRAERELGAANRELVRETMLVKLLENAAIAANQSNTFRHAVEGCTEAVLTQTGWAIGQVWVPANDGSSEFVSGSSWITTDPERYAELQALTHETRIPHDDPDHALSRAISTMQPVSAGGGRLATDDSPRGRTAARLGLRSAVAVPIPSSGEVIALIEFFGADPAPIDKRLIGVLADVGRQIGRVAERIRLHDRLRQSQKLESVGQLAAGIAHEINNPMAYVRANLGMLREEWAALSDLARKSSWPEEALARIADCEELIDESLEGVDRTVSIVRDVREFSHANEISAERVDPNDLVEGALRVATPHQPAAVVLDRTYGDLPEIDCRPGQLSQVFLNLIVNAYQAISRGGTLRVSTEVIGSNVVISFEDDGPGIPPEATHRLFDPFFTTKPTGEGTGLGLFVSYEIVRNHGGEIRVESPSAGGTRFDVVLPT